MATLSKIVLGEFAMLEFGELVGTLCLQQQLVIFLNGDLGMGKTTLCRGILKAFGHQGPVKSPTYTLVEPYAFDSSNVYHFDLYRLGDPEELEYMGIRDYFEESNTLCLLEWPEKGGQFLPKADIVVNINLTPGGRAVELSGHSEAGDKLVKQL
ncbi:MAG: tRNA (adenosine(37)-N6)-threonylcarbamoyltransferase complex ATPase subunit type 1 TsaE [Oceanicoccus sp.]